MNPTASCRPHWRERFADQEARIAHHTAGGLRGEGIVASTVPLSHIDISVGYPERSSPFYHAFRTALGYRRWNIAAPEWSGEKPTRASIVFMRSS